MELHAPAAAVRDPEEGANRETNAYPTPKDYSDRASAYFDKRR